MKKITYIAASSVLLASMALTPLIAFGQTTGTTMPALYDQNGVQVNSTNTTPLPAGNYYLQPNQPNSMVNYYGNGVYYDPTSGMYGGSASNDPNGTAGVDLGTSGPNASSTMSSTTVPATYTSPAQPSSGTTYPSPSQASSSAPNTGLGGEALMNWMILAISGLIIVLGTTYLVYQNRAGRFEV